MGNLVSRTFYDGLSVSLQIFNVFTRMAIARGFMSFSVWPIIVIGTTRDFLYNVFHFRMG